MREDDRAGEPDSLRAETFEPHVGATVHPDGSAVVLTLARVEVDGRAPPDAPRRPFTLTFQGPAALDPLGRDLLPEGLHRCSFGDGAAVHSIHIAPVHTPGGGRQDYEAVFN